MTATAASAETNARSISADEIQHLIEHAAHLLPSQGPITAFVHHNTLHAFENLNFTQAVLAGADRFGCHPYLPENRYRQKVERGRIRAEDIEAVLLDDLGDRADDLLGFLGLRIRLRQAILEYPLHDGPTDDLRWVIADSQALKRFREEVPASTREQFIGETQRWVMRDFVNLVNKDSAALAGMERQPIDEVLRQKINDLLLLFGSDRIEKWSDKKWESFCLHLLWRVCEHGVDVAEFESKAKPQKLQRHRDLLFDVACEDSDDQVNEVLVRFCSAFLDQGFSDWHLPDRELGFYQCFSKLFIQSEWLAPTWRKGLKETLRQLQMQGTTPLESIEQSLEYLGIAPTDRDEYLQQTLLALRGFAGMIWQLETRGDRAYRPLPAGTLVEYIAVRLILEQFAIRSIAQNQLNFDGSLADLPAFINSTKDANPNPDPSHLRDAFRLFEIGQIRGWRPKTLAQLRPADWKMVLMEIHDFPAIERRRIYHLAYERQFCNQTLDAVITHSTRVKQTAEPTKRPFFQIVCCIDEREESFRRALEEIAPDCQTLAAAGFFAVPIYYRGAADAHFTPLCPVIIQPRHYVREEVVYSLQRTESRRKKTRRTIGTVTHRVHVGSRTFTGGWIGTTLLGTLATFPLVARILFPRMTAQFRKVFGRLVRPPEVTKLRLERVAAEPGPADDQLGFSVLEMAATVKRLLSDMGLTKEFARLVFIAGHGSSSMNNPHEAAHDCGACGGGRGGPNARAFSQMANDPRVRGLLADDGLTLPTDTHFVGCYHNTCDDSVTYYDIDQLPNSHQNDFEAAQTSIDQARQLNAHERCRRFESAPLNLTPENALKHVEGRAEDLSQVRPEYGHASNAICLVGSREWSRGLFLDRRAFLQSYEPDQDDENCAILQRILQAVIPVCAGINLEYYFSYVDPVGYGCGTKLPHNITSLVGVMNGAASDLRPGLPWQMVEIHEPVRLLFVIETNAAAMQKIIDDNPSIADLCNGDWVQLAILDSATSQVQVYKNGQFFPYRSTTKRLDVARTSADWYRGWRDHLKFASIGPRFQSFQSADD